MIKDSRYLRLQIEEILEKEKEKTSTEFINGRIDALSQILDIIESYVQ